MKKLMNGLASIRLSKYSALNINRLDTEITPSVLRTGSRWRLIMSELKSCPFCGGFPEIRRVFMGAAKKKEGFRLNYTIKCSDCGIFFTEDSIIVLGEDGQPILEKDGYKECIDKWNRRASND
jgi:Lar family restriction alleviation protein